MTRVGQSVSEKKCGARLDWVSKKSALDVCESIAGLSVVSTDEIGGTHRAFACRLQLNDLNSFFARSDDEVIVALDDATWGCSGGAGLRLTSRKIVNDVHAVDVKPKQRLIFSLTKRECPRPGPQCANLIFDFGGRP